MRIPAEIELPPGRFLAAVSGGADSVAMLRLCFGSVGHVVHVDHQLRGEPARADARFVRELCARLGVGCSVIRREEVAGHAGARSAGELRAMRLAVYGSMVGELGLDGVLLGHHADDVAETVLVRLMRGSGVEGLCGMRVEAWVRAGMEGGRVRLVRPLLGLRREALRVYLRGCGQAWREDESNRVAHTPRNWVRHVLAASPGLTEAVLELSASCRGYVAALQAAARPVAERPSWRVGEVSGLPPGVARMAVRMWLRRSMGAAELPPAVIERVREWSGDAAAARRIGLPGGWCAERRGGRLVLVGPTGRRRG